MRCFVLFGTIHCAITIKGHYRYLLDEPDTEPNWSFPLVRKDIWRRYVPTMLQCVGCPRKWTVATGKCMARNRGRVTKREGVTGMRRPAVMARTSATDNIEMHLKWLLYRSHVCRLGIWLQTLVDVVNIVSLCAVPFIRDEVNLWLGTVSYFPLVKCTWNFA